MATGRVSTSQATAWLQAGQAWERLLESWQAAQQALQPAARQASAGMAVLPLLSESQRAELVQQMLRLQEDYSQRHARLWQAQLERRQPGDTAAAASPNIAWPAPGDRRFASAEWAANPAYDYLRQAYVLNAEWIARLAELMPVESDQGRERLRFVARQYVDAMAPSNFAATNPEFIKAALDSKGESITAGLRNLLADLGKGRISMCDESAFEVGRNLALTEGAVVFENELMQLIQYAPLTAKVAQRPLVIVPPCINKYYILDLQPENSLVRYAVAEGQTVFLVSWRNPEPAQGHLTWDDYVADGVLQALTIAAEICQVEQVNALGFCVGGTLLTTALAVARARCEDPVASLTLLTTLLDFSAPGELGLFIDAASVAARERSARQGSLMKGSELAAVFSALRANDLIWQYVVGNYLKGQAPAAFDLLYWNSDATNLPGPFAAWYLRNMYLENKLCQPDQLTVCGERVDLGRVDAPAFLYVSREDHIVPWQSGFKSCALLSGDNEFVMGASGHIAGVINPPAKSKRSYWTSSYQGNDPEEWFKHAQEQRGSWWPHWAAWLKGHAGRQVAAREKLGNAHYSAIEAAPGRYVRAKAA